MITIKPRITFGIIVLNGEPFVRYNLRSLYPFAHEIIVVEGAYWASEAVATPDGHSVDGTLDALRRFKEEEDPKGIVQIITRDGLWGGLTEQCQAWTERATGDYIWPVDIDEFYRPEDIAAVIELLVARPTVSMISFKLLQFCFSFDYLIHSGRDYIKGGIMECRRVFKFGPGYRYVEHEPPTVLDPSGVDLKQIEYIDYRITSALGIYIYHYTAVFQSQLEAKAKAYSLRGWKGKSEYALRFVENWISLDDPFHLGWEYRYHTWFERFKRPHPPEIAHLLHDLESGIITATVRDNTDIELLLQSPVYRLKRFAASEWERLRVLLEQHVRPIIARLTWLKKKIKCRGAQE